MPRKRKHKGLIITAIVLSVFFLLAAVGSCGSNENGSSGNSPSTEGLEQSTAVETSESTAPMEETEPAPEDSLASGFKEAQEPSSEPELIETESSSPKTESSTENVPPFLAENGVAQYLPDCQKEAPFSMTMLDVKQGLSLLFESDGKYMLYDGGGRKPSSYVFSYVRKHTGGELDYLVSSHYDEDHAAGLIGVLLKDKVGTVLCPDYTNDTEIYSSFASALQGNGAAVVHPKAGDNYQFGNASITVLSADDAADQENDRSITVKVTYGSFSIIVTGDAEKQAEQEMIDSGLDLDADVYVAGHHGSEYSSSSAFLAAVSPAFTFISCGAGNDYGHPAEGMLGRVQAVGSQMVRTDKQGEVTVYSDGANDWLSTDPCQDWSSPTVSESSSDTASDEGSSASNNTETSASSSGEAGDTETSTSGSGEAGDTGTSASEEAGVTAPQETETQNATAGENTQQYVLNTNTMVFHYPWCRAVKRMKDTNKEIVNDTRDNIINQGYKPCGICQP